VHLHNLNYLIFTVPGIGFSRKLVLIFDNCHVVVISEFYYFVLAPYFRDKLSPNCQIIERVGCNI
jgi:hypothetical protein